MNSNKSKIIAKSSKNNALLIENELPIITV